MLIIAGMLQPCDSEQCKLACCVTLTFVLPFCESIVSKDVCSLLFELNESKLRIVDNVLLCLDFSQRFYILQRFFFQRL